MTALTKQQVKAIALTLESIDVRVEGEKNRYQELLQSPFALAHEVEARGRSFLHVIEQSRAKLDTAQKNIDAASPKTKKVTTLAAAVNSKIEELNKLAGHLQEQIINQKILDIDRAFADFNRIMDQAISPNIHQNQLSDNNIFQQNINDFRDSLEAFAYLDPDDYRDFYDSLESVETVLHHARYLQNTLDEVDDETINEHTDAIKDEVRQSRHLYTDNINTAVNHITSTLDLILSKRQTTTHSDSKPDIPPPLPPTPRGSIDDNRKREPAAVREDVKETKEHKESKHHHRHKHRRRHRHDDEHGHGHGQHAKHRDKSNQPAIPEERATTGNKILLEAAMRSGLGLFGKTHKKPDSTTKPTKTKREVQPGIEQLKRNEEKPKSTQPKSKTKAPRTTTEPEMPGIKQLRRK